MKPDSQPTRSAGPANPSTDTFDPALDAGLAAAFGPDLTPGGWSHPPLLRDDSSDHSPLVQPSSTEVPRGASDRYQLLGEIARGGMGVILKGRDPDLGRDLAFKVLKSELASRPAAVQRFVEEAQVGGQLQHPGVVPVYDLGRFADGRPYFAMKLVKGRTLAERLGERADPASERGKFLQIFLQICQTVAYAHAKGVIHRDLKPSNVMVGDYGEVLVVDWGLAKVLPRGGIADEEKARRERPLPEHEEPTVIRTARSGSAAGSDTQAGSVLGTPAFMSPEQAAGEIDKLDERADVFGLGAVLCVVLTGQPPYRADTGEAVRLKAVRGQLADAFARLDASSTDAELVSLCKRCLSADRDERPRHAGEVADAVSGYLATVEQRAHRAELDRAAAEARTAEERNTRREAEAKAAEERKRRRAQLALAASVLLLVCGGGAFGWWRDRAAEEARVAQIRFEGEQKAQQAAFEVERALKAEHAWERARNLLAFAAEARKEYRFSAAAGALREAGELVAGLAPEFVAAVEQAKADLAFVVELDAIRMKRSTWIAEGVGQGRFAEAGAPPAYRAAFAARGLDVPADPATVGERVSSSAVREELVSALDDWAVLEPDEAVRANVLTVLRRADGGSGAAPFRDPALWADRARLEALAAQVDVAKLSPGAVVAIARVMRQQRVDPAPLLRHALSRHPREFLITFSLGQFLPPAAKSEALGAYRAARALRPDNFAVLNNLGIALHESGDVPGAIAAFKEAVRLDPNLASVRFNLGRALHGSGDVPGAIAEYKAAVRLDVKYTPGHNNLGNALRDSGDLPGAIAEYKEAIRLDPKYAPSHNNLGLLLHSSGDLPGAIAEYKEAIRLDPKYVLARNNLGYALHCSGDLPGAIAEYREAIRLAPKYALAHTNLGISLHGSGDVRGAIAAFKESSRLDPKDVKTHTNLGLLLHGSGDVRGAIAAYKEAIQLDPKFAKAHGNLGNALRDSGDVPGAIAAYKEAIRLDPKDAPAHNNLGVTLGASGDVPSAIAALKEAIRLDPKYAAAHSNLGNALLGSGDVRGAIAAYKEAIQLDPKDAAAHSNLGNALRHSGDVPGAIAVLKESIRLDPKDAKAHANLGLALYDARDFPGAIAVLKEAIRLDPKDAVVHGNLGSALRASGDVPGAIAAFKEAIRLDPKDPGAHCILGLFLQSQGRPTEALPFLRQGHELGSKQPGWKYPSAKWVADCERAAEEQQARTAPPPREVKR
jgi:tetratricopeptide (TPR) repeat protein